MLKSICKTFVFAFFAFMLVSGISLPAANASGGGGGEKKAEGEKSSKKGDSDVVGGRFEGDPVYVHVQPVFLPILSDKGPQQIVTIMIDLRVKDLAAADSVRASMPRIRDAIMQALYGGLGNGTLRQGSLVDVLKVKSKVAEAMDKLLGEKVVEEVLIQAIAQRRV